MRSCTQPKLLHLFKWIIWNWYSWLTHDSPVLLFYTPWKHQKTFRFSDVSGGIEKQHRVAMGQGKEILTIVAKLSMLDICGDPGYASARAGEKWNPWYDGSVDILRLFGNVLGISTPFSLDWIRCIAIVNSCNVIRPSLSKSAKVLEGYNEFILTNWLNL